MCGKLIPQIRENILQVSTEGVGTSTWTKGSEKRKCETLIRALGHLHKISDTNRKKQCMWVHLKTSRAISLVYIMCKRKRANEIRFKVR